jgi:hypothetical protein
MRFKQYKRSEIERFCEDNAIEDDEWLWSFIKGCHAKVDMDCSEEMAGCLRVIIQGQDEWEATHKKAFGVKK